MALIENNYRLNLQAAAERAFLNSGCSLRLYTVVSPALSPATVVGDLTEAGFTGYAAASLSGAFAAQTKVIDGQYQTGTGNFTFSCTGGSSQTVLGYFVQDATGLLFAEAFPAGLVMSPGGPSLVISLTYYQYARSILP